MIGEQCLWYILIGILLVSVDVLGPLLANKWVSSVQLQLLGGIVAGPWALDLIQLDMLTHAHVLEVISEIAVIISLYATGIKMRIPLTSGRWLAPLILASVTMVATITLASGLAYWLLNLSLPAAILLGAVLAPTDPVLADKIQLEHPNDRDRLRQSLTGEAGLNDGTAFPFVLLAVGLASPSLHPLGPSFSNWIAIDLLWKISGGVFLGALAGTLLGRFIIWVRTTHSGEQSSEELLTMGLIAVIYGIALSLNTYAFLAVFAAAVGLRRIEMTSDSSQEANEDSKVRASEGKRDAQEDAEQDPGSPVALLKEQTEVGSALERIVQVFLVFVVGVLLSTSDISNWKYWLFGCLMIVIIRPVAVYSTFRLGNITTFQRGLVAWFGIRGIGTLYYLSHSISLGMDEVLAAEMAVVASCCVITIVLSIAAHGSSDAPLMHWYVTQQRRLATATT